MPILSQRSSEFFCPDINQFVINQDTVNEIEYDEYEYFKESILNMPLENLTKRDLNYYAPYLVKYAKEKEPYPTDSRFEYSYSILIKNIWDACNDIENYPYLSSIHSLYDLFDYELDGYYESQIDM